MTEIIVALDVDTLRAAEELLENLHGTITHYKVGLQLFTAHGRRAVERIQKAGGRVFLDLKLLDIPNTVQEAVRQAQRLGVFSISVHLLGGPAMLQAAGSVHPRPKLWGVTVLTSLGPKDLGFLHPGMRLPALVGRLARMGKASHLDGIICSAREVESLSKVLGTDTVFITPGIRPAAASVDDQNRIVTPAMAARLGIRYAVIGRPITKAPDPLRAAQEILREMREAAPSSVERPRSRRDPARQHGPDRTGGELT